MPPWAFHRHRPAEVRACSPAPQLYACPLVLREGLGAHSVERASGRDRCALGTAWQTGAMFLPRSAQSEGLHTLTLALSPLTGCFSLQELSKVTRLSL